MAGHNKWSKIRHKKAAEDAKKGKIFSRLSQQITLSARDSGGDPAGNPTLRLLLDQAKAEGFSSDSVKKAIDKGTGEGGGNALVEASYEGFGPGGIAVIVDVLTDNTNRVVSDLRKLFTDLGGHLGESGAVSWNFETKGYLNIRPGKMKKSEKFGQDDEFVAEKKDDVIMAVMDISGVDDIEDGEDETLDIYTQLKDLGAVRDSILEIGYVVRSAHLAKTPKMYKKIDSETLEKALNFLESVEEYADVQNVWTDLDSE